MTASESTPDPGPDRIPDSGPGPAACPWEPPYPRPHTAKLSLAKRLFVGWRSWIHTLYERSYTMKLGDVRLPRLDMFVANDPAIVARAMDDNRDATDGMPAHLPKHPLLNSMLDPLIGTSVFATNGTLWEEQREMVNPSFQHTNLRRSFPAMHQAVDELVAAIAARDLTRPVDVDPLMTHITADIIFRTLFSIPLDAQGAADIYRAFERYQKLIQPAIMLEIYGLPGLGFRRRALRAAARVHEVFAPTIRARYDRYVAHGDAGPEDILRSLMEARHPRTGAPFTFAELVDQISLIFLAGHETSASALSWALYLIAARPEEQAKLREEVAREARGAPLGYDTLKGLNAVRNVFRETLRLYPPVSFLIREVTAETEMRGKRMKAGSMIVVSPWLIQRNAETWACPHSFDPDRFDRPESKEPARNAWLPFGRGPRVCIGQGFATQEAVLTLAAIVRRFRLEAIPGEVPVPTSRLTLRPKGGVRLRLTDLGTV